MDNKLFKNSEIMQSDLTKMFSEEMLIELLEREYDRAYSEIQNGKLLSIPTRQGEKATFVAGNNWGLTTGRVRKDGTWGDLAYRANIRKFVEKGIVSQQQLDIFKADGHSDRDICGGNGSDMSNVMLYLVSRLKPQMSEERIEDIICEEDMETTYKKATEFSDYEDQYVDYMGSIHRRKESSAQKERIAKIENHTCQICGFRYIYQNSKGQTNWIIEVDHIKEKSQGGGETIDNMLVLCPNCHAKKTYGAIRICDDYSYIEEGQIKALKHNHHLGNCVTPNVKTQ